MVYSTVPKETEILCRNAKVFLDNDDHSIEIMLLKHGDQNCLEVVGYDQVQGKESNRLYLNAKKVRAKLSRKSIDDLSNESHIHSLSHQLQTDQLNRIVDSLTVDFVLSRLNCIVAIEGGQFSITMNTLINESCKIDVECGISDFPSFQFSSLPTGVIPYRTNRPKPMVEPAAAAPSTGQEGLKDHSCLSVEHASPVRRPSVALANVFATSGKLSPKHSNFSGKGGVEAALAAARAALNPISGVSSSTIDGATEEAMAPSSNKSSGGSSSGSGKPSMSGRRRTFEALSTLARQVIPSALVPISRQHSAGMRRNNNNQNEGGAAGAGGEAPTSSLLSRRKKEAHSLSSLQLPSLKVNTTSSFEAAGGGEGNSPTVIMKHLPLTPIGTAASTRETATAEEQREVKGAAGVNEVLLKEVATSVM